MTPLTHYTMRDGEHRYLGGSSVDAREEGANRAGSHHCRRALVCGLYDKPRATLTNSWFIPGSYDVTGKDLYL